MDLIDFSLLEEHNVQERVSYLIRGEKKQDYNSLEFFIPDIDSEAFKNQAPVYTELNQ